MSETGKDDTAGDALPTASIEATPQRHSSWLALDGVTRITAANAHHIQKPSLNSYRDKARRTADSKPALFYRQLTGEQWDGENRSYVEVCGPR